MNIAIVRAGLLALALCAAVPTPAAAADATTRLLEQLDTCDRTTIGQTGPRVDLLLALADGRSALELATLLEGPRRCIGRVSSYGEGADEVVLVGAASPFADAPGAMLWVDAGYWRITTAPLGYWPATRGPTIRADGKEYLIGIFSGGSAGVIGLAAVVISGSSARTTLSFAPSAELGPAQLLSDGRLYVSGRSAKDRALTWSSHVDWPGGAQWLFERTSGSWLLVAQRQALHPHYLFTGLVGGLLTRDVPTMSRYATANVVNAALSLPAPRAGYVDVRYDDRVSDYQLMQEELARWDALPVDNRRPSTSEHLVRTVAFGGTLIGVHFERDADGWRITTIAQLPVGGDVQLRP